MTRDELAQSLGYKSAADWDTQREARTPEQCAAMELQMKRWALAYQYGDAAYNGDIERMKELKIKAKELQ